MNNNVIMYILDFYFRLLKYTIGKMNDNDNDISLNYSFVFLILCFKLYSILTFMSCDLNRAQFKGRNMSSA